MVLYCITVQKSHIFVQLSPIQCTYSNIFIRFFKFSPANTNIYQNSYRVIGAQDLTHGLLFRYNQKLISLFRFRLYPLPSMLLLLVCCYKPLFFVLVLCRGQFVSLSVLTTEKITILFLYT